MKKVLVTGSRDYPRIEDVFNQLVLQFTEPWGILIYGDCPTGADHFAEVWGSSQADIYPVKLKAKWKHPGLREQAGFARNLAMLDLNPDVVLAFYAKGAKNSGTDHCATEARLRNIEVLEFWDQK